MPRAVRGEIWIADLGLAAKVRPVLVLSIPYDDHERALVSCVPRTTSLRRTRFEISHADSRMPDGAFDCQQLLTLPAAKLERRIGRIDEATLARIEEAVCDWLAL